MGLLLLILGLVALLVVMFWRSSGIAMVGSAISVGVALAVVVWLSHTSLPELVGLLYIALAVAFWATSPPAEELAEPIGGTTPFERARKDPYFREQLPEGSVDPPTGDTLTLFDHLWLVGLPILGWIIAFVALPPRIGLNDGVWVTLLVGTPGAGFAFGATDVAALFGLLLIYPGGSLVLSLPLTGLLAILVQFGRNRPTAFAASIEYAVVAVIMNLINLGFYGLR
jgi:hypothetical protein